MSPLSPEQMIDFQTFWPTSEGVHAIPLDAAAFDLFGLTAYERELVADFWTRFSADVGGPARKLPSAQAQLVVNLSEDETRVYDDALREAASDTDDPEEIFERLAYRDVWDACDLLRPIFEETAGRAGYVSFELPASLAFDAERSIELALREREAAYHVVLQSIAPHGFLEQSRLRIGAMVTGNTYRHPAVLGKIATSVDVISNGRLDFGVGAGWNEYEHQSMGLDLPPPGKQRTGLSVSAHGNIATRSSPIVSGRSHITFMFWIAWPAAPFTRLSVTDRMIARPGSRSAKTPMMQWFEPRTSRVLGLTPAGTTWTNGSSS
jgi:hypothetical protein